MISPRIIPFCLTLNVVFGQPSDYFIKLQSCKVDKKPGGWCEWGPWGSCVRSSCTRTRRRVCDCPTPIAWQSDSDCNAVRPQKDFLNESKLIKQTRYIRHTAFREPCDIPVFYRGRYYPDCIPYDDLDAYSKTVVDPGYAACMSDGEVRACEKDSNGQLVVQGMQEFDVGACDGWGTNVHRRSAAPATSRFTYGAESELGQLCSFDEKDGSNQCVRNYFYGPNTASDFGRLTNLAYEIDNCRFACAIRRNCRAIEFIKGVSCALILESSGLADEHYLGVIVETKADVCDGHVKGTYPYAPAVALLESKYDERPQRRF